MIPFIFGFILGALTTVLVPWEDLFDNEDDRYQEYDKDDDNYNEDEDDGPGV